MSRLTEEELEDIQCYDAANGDIDPHDRLRVHRRKLLAEVDALRAERDEARRLVMVTDAAVKAYSEELNGEETEHTYDEIVAGWKADAERRGFEACREAAARMCLDAFHHKAPFWLAKSDSENAAAGIRTLQPPGTARTQGSGP